MISESYRKSYVNPYRSGVKIGNYVEDIFGNDLMKLYENKKADSNHYITESQAQFKWPKINLDSDQNIRNELTSNYGSNFNFNIDFSNKDITDNNILDNNSLESNSFKLKDKNKFLVSEINKEKQLEILQATNPLINIESQNKLKDFHLKDTQGLLNTKIKGINKNLLLSHGLNQNNFYKVEYSSNYK
jgi:hypothetical protein